MRKCKILDFLVMWNEVDVFVRIEISVNIRNFTKWIEIRLNIRNFTKWIEVGVNILNFTTKWIEISVNIRSFTKWIEIILIIRIVRTEICLIIRNTVDSLYLNYFLSRTSLYFKQKARSLGHLCTL